ncbi:EF-hand calcium-binding domain-containing protein 1 [Eufriesea mexicana]|uniref:EF-hand calcium-binding domain-containing protein 1-like n=1 Tax=Eufriesea mexicana TaxID=516756 RepID=UPI00083BCB29|nr:PREDICTED: EF-hand calcium-binding domain-containing protein 1-like [Eufriesea mexicana]OAD59757.1 EF-hand calcium-binding domain-containing protein 1 [Eufriesea mexicana]
MPSEQPVDMLNDTLAEIVYRTKNMQRFKRLARNTHFNLREVEALSIIHRKCVQTLGPISRLTFRDIFHAGFDFTENIRHLLIDKLFSVIDKHNALQIYCDQWIEGLSVMLRGNLDEKIQFAYQVYDSMSTHRLKKEQIFPIMRGCLIKLQNDENPEEAVKDLIDLLIKKLDVDRDGAISQEDFKTAVKERNQLLLECMGPVFPSREARHVFLSTFTDRVGRY